MFGRPVGCATVHRRTMCGTSTNGVGVLSTIATNCFVELCSSSMNVSNARKEEKTNRRSMRSSIIRHRQSFVLPHIKMPFIDTVARVLSLISHCSMCKRRAVFGARSTRQRVDEKNDTRPCRCAVRSISRTTTTISLLLLLCGHVTRHGRTTVSLVCRRYSSY
jgi:hypothetical protein